MDPGVTGPAKPRGRIQYLVKESFLRMLGSHGSVVVLILFGALGPREAGSPPFRLRVPMGAGIRPPEG